MKLTLRKVLAVLLAMAMMLSLAACKTEDPVDNTKDNETTPNDETTSVADEETDYPATADFDFGVFSFNNTEFTFPEGYDKVLLGDNKDQDHGGENVVNVAGHQGYPKPAEGFPGVDKEGEFQKIISENGEFWSNIDRIEGDFYFSGAGETVAIDISNCDEYIQGGKQALNFKFVNSSSLIRESLARDNPNLIAQFDLEEECPNCTEEEDCGECGFRWGKVMTAIWDVAGFKENIGADLFEKKASNENEDGGGGVSKFGLNVNYNTDNNPEKSLDVVPAKINWTDVRVYVYDSAKFLDAVNEVEAALGYKISDNAAANIFEVESEESAEETTEE